MDFNGDGRSDVISGSFPGRMYVFARKSDGTFSARTEITDRDGKPLNAGNASHVFAVDWDGDGDLDLLVGNIAGEVHLIVNNGTRKKPLFDKPQHLKANGKPISVPDGDAGPHAADWDGDGKLDLLVGCGDGSVRWYRNTSAGKVPALAEGKTLVPAHDNKAKKPGCGNRVKVWVADWDGDGRMDLLVGDDIALTVEIKLTEEQKKAKRKAETAAAELEARYRKLSIAPENETDADRKKRLTELKQVEEKYAAAEKSLLKFATRRREYHGFVWLFQRKPKRTAADRR